MKKVILMALVAMLAASPIYAQKINEKSISKSLVGSDEDIANPKKSAKATTWIERGDAYFAALNAPIKLLSAFNHVSMAS